MVIVLEEMLRKGSFIGYLVIWMKYEVVEERGIYFVNIGGTGNNVEPETLYVRAALQWSLPTPSLSQSSSYRWELSSTAQINIFLNGP